jgi:hypothetical protein
VYFEASDRQSPGNNVCFHERESIPGHVENSGNFGMGIALDQGVFSDSIVKLKIDWEHEREAGRKKGVVMIDTILIILVVLWALGFFMFQAWRPGPRSSEHDLDRSDQRIGAGTDDF